MDKASGALFVDRFLYTPRTCPISPAIRSRTFLPTTKILGRASGFESTAEAALRRLDN